MRGVLRLAVTLLALGCREDPRPTSASNAEAGGPAPGRVLVSLIQLIATPVLFEGRDVAVMGYCWVETEGTALYLHEEDHRYFATKNSVSLNFERAQSAAGGCRDRHVLVFGRFSSRGADTVSGSIDVDLFRAQEPVPTEGGIDPP